MPTRIQAPGFPLARGSQLSAGTGFSGQGRPGAQSPPDAGPDAYPEDTMDDGYDLLAVRIRRGTTIDGAIVALCPAEDGTIVADVCIDGPPVP